MAFLGGTGSSTPTVKTGTKTSGFLGGGVPEKKTYTPTDFGPLGQLPMPGVGGVSRSTPQISYEPDTANFLAQTAGYQLRSGLKAGLTLSNGPSINPREDLGNYAAYFLGDEPIQSLQETLNRPGAGPIDYIGQSADIALGLLPLYGSLAERTAGALTRKSVLLPVGGFSNATDIKINKILTPSRVAAPDLQVPKTSPKYEYVPVGPGELPVPITRPELSPITTSGTITKGARDAQTLAAEAGMKSLPEELLARTDPITFQRQAERIAEILDDIEDAKRIGLGYKALPNDVEPSAFYNSMIDYAQRKKDWSLLADLAGSPLATASSRAGRSLVATKINQNPVVQAMREVAQARQASVKGLKVSPQKVRAATKAEVTKEIAAQPTDWNSFIDSITC